jgi:flagellar basal body-associated protein FliL
MNDNNKLPEGWGSASGANTPQGWGNNSAESSDTSAESNEEITLESAQSENADVPKKSNVGIIALIVALVVLIPAGIFGFMHFSGDDESDETPVETSAETTTAETTTAVTTAITTAETETTTQATPTEPTRQDINATDLRTLTTFVETISGCVVLRLSPFESIDDISLWQLFNAFMHYYRREVGGAYYTGLYLEPDGRFQVNNELAMWERDGWTYDTINRFFRANFNSNFSLDNYDYRNISDMWEWCEINDVAILHSGDFGGLAKMEITESYQLGDLYYVHATRLTQFPGDNGWEQDGKFVYTFEQGIYGFDILSMQAQ